MSISFVHQHSILILFLGKIAQALSDRLKIKLLINSNFQILPQIEVWTLGHFNMLVLAFELIQWCTVNMFRVVDPVGRWTSAPGQVYCRMKAVLSLDFLIFGFIYLALTLTSFPVWVDEKHPHNMMLPCFNVVMSSVGFLPNVMISAKIISFVLVPLV